MSPSSAVRLERDGNVAVVVIDNPPVNAGSRAVRSGLLDAVRAISDADDIDAAVIIGAGNTFVAGSDIKEFGKPLEEPQLPAVIAAIEACAKPFVAAIHGASLGGGYELALGCDARVAAPGAVVGLPEVTLGMIPGAGGTQRLPRLVGVAKAIEIVCSGRRVGAKEAAAIGMIDKVIEGDLRSGAVAHARSLGGRKRLLAQVAVPDAPAEQVEKAAADALKAGRGRPHVAGGHRSRAGIGPPTLRGGVGTRTCHVPAVALGHGGRGTTSLVLRGARSVQSAGARGRRCARPRAYRHCRRWNDGGRNRDVLHRCRLLGDVGRAG